MPVRTRSQRAKLSKKESETATNGTQAKPRRSTRISKRNQRKAALKQEEEVKSEELITPQFTTSGENEEIIPYQSNVDEFRQYVQNILDSPNKVDLPKKPVVGPSPRIERITIQQQNNRQMEFLIPPKTQDEPIEIREQIRAALSPENRPLGIASADELQRASSRSPMPMNGTPVYHESTRLWSPNVPNYNQDKAERISRMLIMVIFTILTAVFIASFQDEITDFLKSTVAPSIQSLWNSVTSIWSSIVSGSVSENEGSISSDDSVTK